MLVHWYWIKKYFNEKEQKKQWFGFEKKLYLAFFFFINISGSYNKTE